MVSLLKIKSRTPIRILVGVFGTNCMEAACNGLESHPGGLAVVRPALCYRNLS